MALTGAGIEVSSASLFVVKVNKDGWEKTTTGVSQLKPHETKLGMNAVVEENLSPST